MFAPVRRPSPLRSLARLAPAIGLLLFAPAAKAGWRGIEAVAPGAPEPTGLTFRGEQAVVRVSAITSDVVRVRVSPGRAFGRDHSYALASPPGVVPGEGSPARVSIEVGRDRSTLVTSTLRVEVTHAPFRVTFRTASGELLDEDDPERGTAIAGTAMRVWKRLRPDDHVYGLGEKTGPLDKRGRKLGGTRYTMWNSDTYAYDLDTDPIYASVPFFLVTRGGRAHGIFLDNTFRSSFDIGHGSEGLLSFGADGGELDYTFIHGPSPKEVVQRYTALTGRTPLPPRWALGYHQCRYSYFPEAKLRAVADGFRARHIPADVLWLDIHYQDGYKPFTWDARRFPDPARMIGDLRRQGLRVVTIVDPHPKVEKGYLPYDSGLAGGHFVKRADGSLYLAPVWPSQAERNPGPSVFPDFSRPATRDWWGSLHGPLLALGVAGLWNDMNEPAVFAAPSGTMPLDVRHDNEGQPTDHREIHNVYGMLMSRASFEALGRARPNERPFVLTRATFAGGQRYAAVWTGDNQAEWTHLRGSIPTLLGLGLSGFVFVGSDIGGFVGDPSPELYTRWLQAGIFYPFMRTHSVFGSADREPWSFGPEHEALNRRAIELRYELLPHIYNVMHEASVTGLPAMRPLFLESPGDGRLADRDDQFLFGRDLLVAPVLRRGERERELLLPAGDWYDLWTGRREAGGRTLRVPVTLASIPVFVRGGAFLFRQPVVQHTAEMPGQPLIVTVFPAERSEATLYEDDGETLGYTRAQAVERKLTQTRGAGRIAVEVSAPRGSYRPAARRLVFLIRTDAAPRRVSLGGRQLERRGPSTPATTEGWSFDGSYVRVETADRFDALALTLEGRSRREDGRR